jgi:hypothetical protein
VSVAWIRVHLGGRYAGTRRWATFTAANERSTSLAVDERDMDGDLMMVGVLAENDGEVLIRLPRAGVVGEWVAVVPREMLITMDAERRWCLVWGFAGMLVMAVAIAVGLWAAT